jgi:hypothetical protein
MQPGRQFQGTYSHAGRAIRVNGSVTQRYDGTWKGWFFFNLGEVGSVQQGTAQLQTDDGHTWILEVFHIDDVPPIGRAYFDVLTWIP